MPGVQAGLKPGAVQPGAGCARRGAAGGVTGGQGLHLLGLGCFPVSGAGCPPSQAPPGRAGTQPRRDAHRAQGGLSPWLAVSRPPARPGPPAAPGPGAGKMTAAPRWSRAGVPRELADVIRRLLRGLLAACRLPSDSVAGAGVAGTGGRQTAAMGFQAGQDPRAPRPRGSGPAWIPAPAPRPVCPDADACAVSRQPGRPRPVPAGTPALPRARPGPAAAAGSRIVHLLRRLRRPRPGPAACPPARRRPESRAARQPR